MTMTEQTGEKISEKKRFYFKDPFADLAFLHTLTLHGFKGSEIGECYYAASSIEEGDPQSWREAWSTLAEKIEGIGSRAKAKGHRASPRGASLRAVPYSRNAAMALRPADPSFQTA